MAELSKTYDPKSVEPKWYARWIENRDFQADPSSSKPAFSIVMPPPNITGVLTLGHVLNNTIQDILARRARMQGFEVLWLAGNGPRRRRHTDRGRKTSPSDREKNATRSRPRRISAPRAGMAGETWRHHHRTTQTPGLFMRLVAPTLHAGRSIRPRGPECFCRSLQKRTDLSRPPHDQLGPGGANRALR